MLVESNVLVVLSWRMGVCATFLRMLRVVWVCGLYIHRGIGKVVLVQFMHCG